MRARADLRLGGAASATLGVAGMLALAGTISSQLPVAVAAGAVSGVAGFVILAAGWVEGLWLVAVSLPLPALYASEEARLPPILLVSTVVVCAWLVGAALDGRPMRKIARDAWGLAAVWTAVLVAAVFADDHLEAAREVVNFGLLLGLYVVTLDLVALRRGRAHVFARWVALAAAVAGSAAVAEALGLLPTRFPLRGSGFFRAAGGFGWPNELAMFLGISFPLTIHQVRCAGTPAARLGSLVMVGLTALGLGATFSRGSWLSVTAAPGVLLFVGERRTALRFWGAAALGAVALDLASGGAILARIMATSSDVLVVQRLFLTLAGLLMFQAHPFVGVGPGGFGGHLQEFGVQVSGLFDFEQSAQNGYVQMAAESGVVGLLALLVFVGGTFRVLLRSARHADVATGVSTEEASLRTALLWSFTTACVVSLFEWPFAHGVGELIVVVAASGVALARERSRS